MRLRYILLICLVISMLVGFIAAVVVVANTHAQLAPARVLN